MASLEIASADAVGLLPTCTPSLMPFHISYSGPAPVSRYLRPRPASSLLADSTFRSSSSTTTLVGNSSTSGLNETAAFSSTTSVATLVHEGGSSDATKEAGFSGISSSSQMVVDPVTDVRLEAMNATTTMEMDSDTQPADDASLRSTRDNTHTSASRNVERVVAAFRGRQMYGQAVDIPGGYGGLVLRAPSGLGGKGKEDGTTSKPLSQRAKSKTEVRVTTRRSKRATLDGPADEPEGGGSDDCHLDADVDPLRTTKKLTPSSTFSSFMLWAPDRPVDEGRDEYVRTLGEWTRLAAEIHAYDE